MATTPRRSLSAPLLGWYAHARRDLPWRRSRDPYAIWLSEVMLQQTQVTTVIPYWNRFLERFPTAEALAAAELPEVLALWSGLGYYARARALHRAAQAISTEHGGKLPGTAEALRELPGFGPYTAGAVASIAFGERTPLVDGNVLRVLARVFEVEGEPASRAVQKRVWELAGELVPAQRPGDFNQALMELGATLCTPKTPDCPACPLRSQCGALRTGRVDALPSPKARPVRKRLRMTCVVALRRGRVLLARRPERGLFAGLWELPGAEGNRAALATALGSGFTLGAKLGTVERTLTHRELELELVTASAAARPQHIEPYLELRWANPREAAALGMSSAMRACLELVWPEARTSGRRMRHP